MKTSFDVWLKNQVARLEEEIRRHPVFESDEAPTSEQLAELRRLATIHRFLAMQLERLPEGARVRKPYRRRAVTEIDARQFVSA